MNSIKLSNRMDTRTSSIQINRLSMTSGNSKTSDSQRLLLNFFDKMYSKC